MSSIEHFFRAPEPEPTPPPPPVPQPTLGQQLVTLIEDLIAERARSSSRCRCCRDDYDYDEWRDRSAADLVEFVDTHFQMKETPSA